MSRNSASVRWGDFFRAKRPPSFNYEIKSILQRNAANVNYKIKRCWQHVICPLQLAVAGGPPELIIKIANFRELFMA
jgi:hypothetical protein